jgi:hypothetical protein
VIFQSQGINIDHELSPCSRRVGLASTSIYPVACNAAVLFSFRVLALLTKPLAGHRQIGLSTRTSHTILFFFDIIFQNEGCYLVPCGSFPSPIELGSTFQYVNRIRVRKT